MWKDFFPPIKEDELLILFLQLHKQLNLKRAYYVPKINTFYMLDNQSQEMIVLNVKKISSTMHKIYFDLNTGVELLNPYNQDMNTENTALAESCKEDSEIWIANGKPLQGEILQWKVKQL